MNIETNKDNAPFRFTQYDPGMVHKLFNLEGNKTKLVRETPYYKGTDNLFEVVKTVQALTRELASEYGILTPGMQFVIGESTPDGSLFRDYYLDPTESIYIVVDKVAGTDFSHVEFADSELDQTRDELDKLVTLLGRYTEDNYKSGKNHLRDIVSLHQYVYGTLGNDQQKRFYLVDVAPDLISAEQQPFDLYPQRLNIVELADDIAKAEQKLKGRQLTQARLQLETILGLAPESNPDYQLAQKAKEQVIAGNFDIADIFQD